MADGSIVPTRQPRTNADAIEKLERMLEMARGVDSWSAPQSVWAEFEQTGRYVSRRWSSVG